MAEPASDWDLLVDSILARAPELRGAGVLSVALGAVAVTFAPLEMKVQVGEVDAPEKDLGNVDPLHDPASYPDGVVPGFDIQPLDEV